MAFTYEELELWIPGKAYPAIGCTLVITQEDGRTAYASGNISNAVPHFSGNFPQQFSDRQHGISLNGSNYIQNFIVDTNSVDLSDFQFHKTAPTTFKLTILNKRWNATVNIVMTKAASAKIYAGWGETIGHGSGLALYAFSINSAIETPG